VDPLKRFSWGLKTGDKLMLSNRRNPNENLITFFDKPNTTKRGV
jgi:hypothetical protein